MARTASGAQPPDRSSSPKNVSESPCSQQRGSTASLCPGASSAKGLAQMAPWSVLSAVASITWLPEWARHTGGGQLLWSSLPLSSLCYVAFLYCLGQEKSLLGLLPLLPIFVFLLKQQQNELPAPRRLAGCFRTESL